MYSPWFLLEPQYQKLDSISMKQKFTICIYTENQVGLLHRLTTIFTRRHINIESLTTSRSEIEDVNRFIIVAKMSETQVKKIVTQLEKQIEVIRAYYHTDEDGLYSPGTAKKSKAVRHGYIRGWVKTDAAGQYSIYTTRPAPYPNLREIAHIHLAIKEPRFSKPYYIDNVVFDDDKMLTGTMRKKMHYRGGSGVVRLLEGENGMHIGEHDIFLGLNIPNYPKKYAPKTASGLNVGEDVLSFNPYHLYGPDKGEKVCPVCKYGRYLGIILAVGPGCDWDNVRNWLSFFEKESAELNGKLKVYLVATDNQSDRAKLIQLGKELELTHSALTVVPSFTDKESRVDLLKIDPANANTILLYKRGKVKAKWVDEKANDANVNSILEALRKEQNDYFDLPVAHKRN